MSISGSMSSALSGLTVAAKSAELISSNIANVLTEGYGRRELQTAARLVGTTGSGVQAFGVKREINRTLLADRRIADALSSNVGRQADFMMRLETAYGTPGDASSLNGRLAAFDTALISATGQPESSIRQNNVLDAANALAVSFHMISNEIQTLRSLADKKITAEVDQVNRALVSIAELNRNITALASSLRDSSSLVDQRQQLIDIVATIIPIREAATENGRVTLYSTGGAVLLDGKPAKLEFSPVGLITPDMTFGSGALSGLRINGRAINTGLNGPIAGGSLAAEFAIRDDIAPAAQADLDSVARDLIIRFQDPSLDATLLATGAGLFTDGNTAFAVLNEEGVASRIGINAAVDPNRGGAVWRLRDGIGATVPGAAGQAALFVAMQSALNDSRSTASGQFAGASRGALALSSQVISSVTNERLSLEAEAGFSAARATALHSLELEDGVDTDRELQDLLLVEQAFAANAKVIQTADEMIQVLLGM